MAVVVLDVGLVGLLFLAAGSLPGRAVRALHDDRLARGCRRLAGAAGLGQWWGHRLPGCHRLASGCRLPGPGRRQRGALGDAGCSRSRRLRSEEHTSELQSLMRISSAVVCLKKKNKQAEYKAYPSQPNE